MTQVNSSYQGIDVNQAKIDDSSLREVPLLSLSDYLQGGEKANQFVQNLGDALRICGFVRIKDHGVNSSEIRQAYALFESFFNLPVETKMNYFLKGKGGQRGYTAYKTEHAKYTHVGDLKEFWHVGQEVDPSHPFYKIYGDNLWPQEVPDLKKSCLKLYRDLETCGKHLLEAMSLYLHMPKNYLPQMIDKGNTILRAIHYPPLPDHVEPQAVRSAAHEDINLITILCEATESGLELLKTDGTWLPVETLGGEFVVDCGDMLQRLTNDYFKSTTHRVVNPPKEKNRARYSLPFFIHPHPEVLIECCPTCKSPEVAAKYPPIVAHDLLCERIKEIGLTK